VCFVCGVVWCGVGGCGRESIGEGGRVEVEKNEIVCINVCVGGLNFNPKLFACANLVLYTVLCSSGGTNCSLRRAIRHFRYSHKHRCSR
jgi:hypothetical protein